jgi:hypothetical protein
VSDLDEAVKTKAARRKHEDEKLVHLARRHQEIKGKEGLSYDMLDNVIV